ncbi:LysR family transcriptional regulator [Granulosicoccus antarcticus]|uniref:HTH-type transcriptional regulator CynR n=1 Tax=Granulosicoccus antarcticus IMCC3135 TaxID=1192854 RepID=A0A2Z2NT88_9GAMM|nr:LysR family transcriptional regulator [Granulosicoccus antarcticus]ASJ73261.1 HTH-type transcriptional regulator CynR [Granulosicoccus antarcticus IMCC3135]
MNLKQLRNFVTIVELNSITAAGKQLGVAQPALSRQVTMLEEKLGVSLLTRHGRGVVPTDEGIRLATKATAILEQFDDLIDDFSGTKRDLSGSLTLGLPPSVADVMAAHLIDRTLQIFPAVNLRITSGYSGHVQDWLSRGKIDLGIAYGGRQPHSVKVRPIIEEELFFIQKSDEPTHDSSPIKRADALKQPLILPNQEHFLRMLIDTVAEAEGVAMNVVLELDILPTTLSCVERGMGSTILPMVSAFQHVRDGKLLARPIVDEPITRRLDLLSSLNRPLKRLTDVYSDFLIAEIHNLVSTGEWPGQVL